MGLARAGRWKWAAGVAGIYTLSLILPAIDLGPNDPPAPSGVGRGWEAALLGGLLLFLGEVSLMFPVLANPVLLIGLALLAGGLSRGAMAAGLCGTLLAAGAWLVPGHVMLVGSYVWVGSMVALTLAGWISWRAGRRTVTPGSCPPT
jgi:hypothetical protein